MAQRAATRKTAGLRQTAPRGMIFGLGDLPQVRRMTRQWAARAGLVGDRAADFVLAVHEVAANAVLYGSAAAQLVLRVVAGVVAEAEVLDRGGGPPGAGPPVRVTRGGVGLRVVRMLCDEVEVRAQPAGTTVLLRMRLAGSRVAQSPAESLPATLRARVPAAAA
ncbi:MAG: ATP-binding protein [Streptosporangiaceae bacterium]